MKTYETVIHVVKVKNGEDGFDFRVMLSELVLGKDSDDDDVTTLIVDSVEVGEAEAKAKAKTKASTPRRESQIGLLRLAFVKAYHDLAGGLESSPGLDGKPVRKVKVDDIRDHLKEGGWLECDDDENIKHTAVTRFGAVRKELIATGSGQQFAQRGKLIWMLYRERPYTF